MRRKLLVIGHRHIVEMELLVVSVFLVWHPTSELMESEDMTAVVQAVVQLCRLVTKGII